MGAAGLGGFGVVAGDDADAIKIASALIRDVGYEPVLVGTLAAMGKYLIPGTPLAGERSPVDDKDLRAAFVNLSLRTTRAALVRAVLEGSTFVSSSGTTNIMWPCSFAALSTLDEAEYSGPSGQPIHCSFHQILSMRLSWQPAEETATL